MSGHSHFEPIGQHPSGYQPIPQPGVGQPQNAPGINVGAQQPGPDAPVADNGADHANALARELDALLAKAGKSAVKDVDAESLAKTVKDMKFDKEAVDALGDALGDEYKGLKSVEDLVAKVQNAAKEANAAMRALDTVTGADIMNALKVDQKTKLFEWSEDPAYKHVGRLVQDAIDKQRELSALIGELLGNMPADVKPSQKSALYEAMLQCDRRSSEIGTLVIELADAVEKNPKVVDSATAARLGRNIVDMAGEKALVMHDAKAVMDSFKTQFAHVSERLDHYANNPYEKPTKAELRNFQSMIDNARNAVRSAAAAGAVTVQVANGRTRTVEVDRTLLGELEQFLGKASDKLKNIKKNAGRELRRKFVEKEIPGIKYSLLQPRFFTRLRAIVTKDADSKAAIEALVRIAELHAKLRQAFFNYADNPTSGNEEEIQSIANELNEDRDIGGTCTKGIIALIKAGSEALESLDDELRSAFTHFMNAMQNKDERASFPQMLDNLAWHHKVPLEHLKAMADKVGKSGIVDKVGLLPGIFSGEGSFTTLVESRVHGYKDGDIDPKLDDRNVIESKELGSGQFNKVDLVTFKDGTKRVFKPEFVGRLGAERIPILTGIPTTQQITNINVAVNRTADALGLGDVMVKTTAGVHNGVFGMYMEAAPGMEGRKLSNGSRGSEAELSKKEIMMLPTDKKKLVKGRMMRQFNRLQWFDIITGQGDRHDRNYMVQVKKDDYTVTVKCIDNDASFSVLRTGLHTFKIPQNAIRGYKEAIKDLADNYGASKDAAIAQAMEDLNGLQPLKDGSIEVDVSKAKSPLLAVALYEKLGFQRTSVPAEMDSDLYDKLVSLATGGARTALLDEWAKRFGKKSQQYLCAVKRLDQAIARAKELMKQGKVYTAQQWESEDVQNKLADVELPQSLTLKKDGQEIGSANSRFSRDYNISMADNYLFSDFGKWGL